MERSTVLNLDEFCKLLSQLSQEIQSVETLNENEFICEYQVKFKYFSTIFSFSKNELDVWFANDTGKIEISYYWLFTYLFSSPLFIRNDSATSKKGKYYEEAKNFINIMSEKYFAITDFFKSKDIEKRYNEIKKLALTELTERGILVKEVINE